VPFDSVIQSPFHFVPDLFPFLRESPFVRLPLVHLVQFQAESIRDLVLNNVVSTQEDQHFHTRALLTSFKSVDQSYPMRTDFLGFF